MFIEAYNSNEDLKKYSPNGLLLFALMLKYGIDDIEEIASDIITDGNDDKKVDMVYVNVDESFAVIAQGYEAVNQEKKSAPANKASDLNTGVSWLFTRSLDELPKDIKSAAIQLRNAVKDKEIKRIEIWYVHNLPESKNVQNELKTVELTASSILKDSKIDIISREVGFETLSEWYSNLETPILVNEDIEININGGFEISESSWKSFTTSINGKDIYKLYKKYDKKLFSANIRDYLGSRKSDSNINNNIKKTAEEEGQNFFVYNNGLTAITHEYKIDKDKIILKGISIVNGAQTTGSVGSLNREPNINCHVPIRIIKCHDNEIIQNIVKYNNSQNKITATDFRSNDIIQTRLKKEFDQEGYAKYYGGRRGGAIDAIRRPGNLIPSDTAAQALSAFHKYPNIAYNKKSEIWKDDKIYSLLFNENTTAKHIVFSYSLFLAINRYKMELKLRSNNLLDSEMQQLDFLRLRGANYILITAISFSIESIIGKQVPNKFRLEFKNISSIDDAVGLWINIIKVVIPFNEQLKEPTNSSLKNTDDVNKSIGLFKSLIDATKIANSAIYKSFSEKVHC